MKYILLLILLASCTTTLEAEKKTAPDFTLVNQEGDPVSLQDYEGKIVLMTFIYTSCNTACPLLTHNFAQLQEKLGDRFGTEVFLVSVSFDAATDSPGVLKEYAEEYNANLEGWSFLTGDLETTTKVTNDYGVWFQQSSTPGVIDHTNVAILIDQQGNIHKEYYGTNYNLDEVITDVDELLS